MSEIEKEIFETRLRTAYSPKKRVNTFGQEKKTYDGYVGSRFVVDFGSIMMGENKTIQKEIASITPFSISFEIITDFPFLLLLSKIFRQTQRQKLVSRLTQKERQSSLLAKLRYLFT